MTGVHTMLLCEDLQLACFIRRFLIRQGLERRQIRTAAITPSGAGLTWLRGKLPDEIKAFRSRNPRAETCLVVGCDADMDTVEQRISMLKAACAQADVPFRAAWERIAFVIPRRNIETWLAYLRGQPVNETDTYPKYDDESECRDEVARLDQMCRRQKLEPDPPPKSLVFACQEFKRLA